MKARVYHSVVILSPRVYSLVLAKAAAPVQRRKCADKRKEGGVFRSTGRRGRGNAICQRQYGGETGRISLNHLTWQRTLPTSQQTLQNTAPAAKHRPNQGKN